ncbi:MAG: hypothetical protein IKL00_04335 [Oscillospiraceae bacterium]|nr:hypothetical protein [Oscillospiraceae bacterium]
MTILNWIIAITAGICGLWITGANWLVLIRWCRTKCTASTIPFVGGALLAISLFNTPLKYFCWVGLLIDYGFWTGIFGLPYLIKQMLDEYRNRK